MNLFKNKHLILAMFVAPVLAIIAYFATDYVVSEKPHRAMQGSTYKLAAKSNCRYQSGQCTLHNGDVEVRVTAEQKPGSFVELVVSTSMPAQRVLASVSNAAAEGVPVALEASGQNTVWRGQFIISNPERDQLRIAMELSGALFYAETSTVFIHYDTAFSRENFSE